MEDYEITLFSYEQMMELIRHEYRYAKVKGDHCGAFYVRLA